MPATNRLHATSRRWAAWAMAGAAVLGSAACSNPEPAPAPSRTAATSTTSPATSTAPTSAAAPQPGDILRSAKANALAAKSGGFKGDIRQGGSTLQVDFKGTMDGKRADVSIEQKSSGRVRVIVIGRDVYIQADAKFWKEQGAPKAVLDAANKFVKAPAKATGITDITLKSFLTKAFSSLDTSQIDARVGSEVVDGVECWVLTDAAGKANGAFYVSKAELQLVRFTGTKESPGQLDFSQWNADLGIAAPAKDQVIDLG